MQLTELISKTITGLGYEFVDHEWAQGLLLRIYIDKPGGITIVDCENVTRQLQHLFIVEHINYERLEISSPGLERPLRKLEDFVRFVGYTVNIILKKPIEGQKKFCGILCLPEGEMMRLDLKQKTAEADKSIRFMFSDIDRARLVPQLDLRSQKK